MGMEDAVPAAASVVLTGARTHVWDAGIAAVASVEVAAWKTAAAEFCSTAKIRWVLAVAAGTFSAYPSDFSSLY